MFIYNIIFSIAQHTVYWLRMYPAPGLHFNDSRMLNLLNPPELPPVHSQSPNHVGYNRFYSKFVGFNSCLLRNNAS